MEDTLNHTQDHALTGSNTPFRRMNQQKNTTAPITNACGPVDSNHGKDLEKNDSGGMELHSIEVELAPEGLQIDTAGVGGIAVGGGSGDTIKKRVVSVHRRTSKDQSGFTHSPGGTNYGITEKRAVTGVGQGMEDAAAVGDEDEDAEYDSESEEEEEEEGDEGDSDYEDGAGHRLDGIKMSEMPFSPTHIPFTPTLSGAFKTSHAQSSKGKAILGTPESIPPPPPLPSSSTSTVSPGPGFLSPALAARHTFYNLMNNGSKCKLDEENPEAVGVDKLLVRDETPTNLLRHSSCEDDKHTNGNSPIDMGNPIEVPTAFGLGATKSHPWTSRMDGGINSRLSTGIRGNEIYYCGVIDILQQYNFSKQFENFFKVRQCNIV